MVRGDEIESYVGFDPKKLTGRNRRLLKEWQLLVERFRQDSEVDVEVTKTNVQGLPIEYRVVYNVRSLCGVGSLDQVTSESDNMQSEAYDLRGTTLEEGDPRFADRFVMMLTLPSQYPCVDALAQLSFVDRDGDGACVAMPWHPNIRYYGSFRGRVCLNAMDSSVELVWCVDRVARYLRYELYHSIQEPPYPEDLRVARWFNHNIDKIDWTEIK